jgi:hypothetical protein
MGNRHIPSDTAKRLFRYIDSNDTVHATELMKVNILESIFRVIITFLMLS